MPDERILLTLRGPQAAVRPAGYLGAARFAAYRDAAVRAGAQFDPSEKCYHAPTPQVPIIIERLEGAGFRAVVAPDLAAQLRAHAATMRRDLDAAQDHLATVERELDARGLKLFGHQREAIAWLGPRRRAALFDQMGLGKLQPNSEPILTPTGWTTMGAVRPGMSLVGSDGQPTRVLGVYPQGERDIVRVTCQDGSWCRASLDHLWAVQHVRNDAAWRWRTMSTAEICERGLRDGAGNHTWRIPLVAPVEFAPSTDPLPLDPYRLGVILGEGLALLGGDQRWKSRIPPAYLLAAPADRLALVQGLLDTGGRPMASGGIEFSSTAEALVDGVTELVQSLGGIARNKTERRTRYQGGVGRPSWRCNIKLPPNVAPFRLTRKAHAWQPPTKYPATRIIDRIDPDGREAATCVRVAAADHLYVTRQYVVTHNTISALMALPRTAPAIVVCPASVKLNWANEAQKWRPDVRVRVLSGRAKWEWPISGEICVANYAVLPRLDRVRNRTVIPEQYGEPAPDTCVILDEAHYCKNSRAQRTRSARAVTAAALAREGRAWLLTGTPLTNRPPELWAVLRAAQLAEPAFGTWPEFRALFGGREGKYGLEWTDEIDASVPERLRRVSLYRRRDDVLDLPSKMRTVISVPGQFPPDIRKLLDRVVATLADHGVDLDEAAELVDLTKVTGAAFEELSRARSALAIAKIPAMIDCVAEYEAADEPLVVFSAHRAPIVALGAREGWACITGSTPVAQRQAIVEAFQAGKLRGVACTIKAGGIGITLTHACQELFVDCAWTPADNNQAEDRCARIGQTRSVLVRRMVADHQLDRKVEWILRRKQELIDAAVEPSAIVRARVDHTRDLRDAAHRLERTVARSGPPPMPQAPPPPQAPEAQAPQAPEEAWVIRSLLTLARGDAFRAVDRGMGAHLARQARAHGALAPDQYPLAARMLAHYTDYVGPRPGQEQS